MYKRVQYKKNQISVLNVVEAFYDGLSKYLHEHRFESAWFGFYVTCENWSPATLPLAPSQTQWTFGFAGQLRNYYLLTNLKTRNQRNVTQYVHDMSIVTMKLNKTSTTVSKQSL